MLVVKVEEFHKWQPLTVSGLILATITDHLNQADMEMVWEAKVDLGHNSATLKINCSVIRS